MAGFFAWTVFHPFHSVGDALARAYRRMEAQPVHIDLDIEDWPAGEWQRMAREAAAAVGEVEPLLDHPGLQVSVLLTNDEEIHALNRAWRSRDKPTNVLSFPMLTRDDLAALAKNGPPAMLGDIALAHGVCAREAAENGVSLADHATHLVVHALLHLAGHDHVESDEQAEAMEALEIAALAKLGIADPYGDRN